MPRDFLTVDPNILDEEWVEQPKLFCKYAQRAADLSEVHDRAKANMALADAELDRTIRASPEEYGLSKVTEATISAAIICHPEHQAALGEVIETRHAQATAQGIVAALDHRKRALQALVDLHGQSYFATPRAEGGAELEKQATRRRGRRPRKKNV